jgi:hypothetical protein
MADIPDWLNPHPNVVSIRDVMYAQFDNAYPGILESITEGNTLADALNDHPRHFSHGMYMTWINRSPERVRQYKEAKELRAEAWAGEMREIAKAEGSLEDVARSKLRVDTYKFLIGADNRSTYGDTKQVNVAHSVSITAALADARQRLATPIERTPTERLPYVIEHDAIEHTPEAPTEDTEDDD